jgi:hypothetical protein
VWGQIAEKVRILDVTPPRYYESSHTGDSVAADQPPGTFDVFLSHPHTEAAAVETIGSRLVTDAGLSVWLDRWVLVPGDCWQQHLARGLDQARTCAVFLGSDTPSGWFRQEIQRALDRQARDATFRVIPVILPTGDRRVVDGFLELRTWVEFKHDLRDPDAFHLLVCGVRGVPPGRPVPAPPEEGERTQVLKSRLSRLRDLRAARLIDDEIALEYQRRLLDELVKPERP